MPLFYCKKTILYKFASKKNSTRYIKQKGFSFVILVNHFQILSQKKEEMQKLQQGLVLFIIGILSILITSCGGEGATESNSEKLPIIPKLDKETREPIEHTIRPFSFINQDSQIVNNATFKDKIYVANEFFIHCPIVCPKVKGNMKYMYEKLEGNDDVLFLSHAIDTKRDTVGALKKYADKLEIETDRWHMVTGDKAAMYEILIEDYLSSAKEDEYADGGFDHSGYLILVDKAGHVRSFARGTDRKETERLLADIKKLQKEYE